MTDLEAYELARQRAWDLKASDGVALAGLLDAGDPVVVSLLGHCWSGAFYHCAACRQDVMVEDAGDEVVVCRICRAPLCQVVARL